MVDRAKRLRQLENENIQHKRAIADPALDDRILKDVAEGNHATLYVSLTTGVSRRAFVKSNNTIGI